MLKTFSTLLFVVLITFTHNAFAVTATFSTATRSVTPGEVGDGATAGATVHEFFVTTDADIVSVDQVDLTSITLYQNATFGSNVVEPNPALFPSFPSVEADTFITTPGGTAAAIGPVGSEFAAVNNSWFDSSNDGAQSLFRFAQLTTTDSGSFIGRLNLNDGLGGVANFPFSFPLGGIPEPSSIILASLGLVGVFTSRRRKS